MNTKKEVHDTTRTSNPHLTHLNTQLSFLPTELSSSGSWVSSSLHQIITNTITYWCGVSFTCGNVLQIYREPFLRTRSSPSMSWSKHFQSVWPLLSLSKRVYSDRLKADLSLSLTTHHCMLLAGTLLLKHYNRYARWFRLHGLSWTFYPTA